MVEIKIVQTEWANNFGWEIFTSSVISFGAFTLENMLKCGGQNILSKIIPSKIALWLWHTLLCRQMDFLFLCCQSPRVLYIRFDISVIAKELPRLKLITVTQFAWRHSENKYQFYQGMCLEMKLKVQLRYPWSFSSLIVMPRISHRFWQVEICYFDS